MDIHLLDIIMYFVLSSLLWILLPSDYKQEMGLMFGFFFEFLFLVIYLIIFAAFDLNWIDLIPDFNSINFSM